jgi:HEPN domain-containing protein
MAQYLYNGDFFRGACYNAQQAVEKTLKARLLTKGWQLEKIHNMKAGSSLRRIRLFGCHTR